MVYNLIQSKPRSNQVFQSRFFCHPKNQLTYPEWAPFAAMLVDIAVMGLASMPASPAVEQLMASNSRQ